MQSHTYIFRAIAIFLGLFAAVNAQEVGQIDESFGRGGHLLGQFSHSLKQVSALLSLPGGDILVAGNIPAEGENRVWLARYHRDGSLDRNFGFQGKLPLVEMDQVSSLASRRDGSLLVGGSIFNGKDTDFAVLCLDSKGMPVREFADNGLRQIDLHGAEQVVALAQQPDGMIIAAGQGSPLRGQATDFLVLRLTESGDVDSRFGLEGLTRVDLGRYDQCREICLQPDGKILIAGNSKVREAYEMAMIRLLPNGMPDLKFGEEGHRLIPVGISGDFARSLALQKDGKILLAGHTQVAESDFDWFVLRLNEDGSPDLKFGNLSILALNLGHDDFLGGLGLQADGKLLLAGTSDFGFAVARLHEDGRIDRSFSEEGIRRISGPQLQPVYGNRFVMQQDGKLLLAGASQGDLLMLRLNGCPVLPGLGSLLQEVDGEDTDGEALRLNLLNGFEVAARFEAPLQPDGKTRGGRMSVQNHIVGAAFLRLGKSRNIQIVIDSEEHMHLFGEGKYLKTLSLRKERLYGRL